MRKFYISTLMFFDYIKNNKTTLFTLSPIQGVSSTYSMCYSKGEDFYCIIVNDEEMTKYIMQKAIEVMGGEGHITRFNEAPQIVEFKKESKKKKSKLLSFWS